MISNIIAKIALIICLSAVSARVWPSVVRTNVGVLSYERTIKRPFLSQDRKIAHYYIARILYLRDC